MTEGGAVYAGRDEGEYTGAAGRSVVDGVAAQRGAAAARVAAAGGGS
jgi:hypothetical protein